MCFNQGHGTLCALLIYTSKNTAAEGYLLEQKYYSKIFSLYSKKDEDTGAMFKNKYFFLGFWGLIHKQVTHKTGGCKA